MDPIDRQLADYQDYLDNCAEDMDPELESLAATEPTRDAEQEAWESMTEQEYEEYLSQAIAAQHKASEAQAIQNIHDIARAFGRAA